METTQALPDLMSTTECRKIAQCSNHFIIAYIKRGLLPAIQQFQGKRLVWKIYRESFEAFLKNHVEKNHRVGKRGFYPDTKRNPCISRGYRQIFQPSHHRSDCNGYVPEHILVMEKHLKRKILKPEQVHHIDGNRLNNKPSNLKVYASMSEHLKKGHSEDYKVRITLRRLFANPTKKLLQLPIEKQAEYFRMLVQSELL